MAKAPKKQKDPKAPKITRLTLTRMLPCKLSPTEMEKFATDLVATRDKIDAIEVEKKVANEKFKADASLLEEAATKIQDMIRAKSEEREVKCEQETDYRAGEIRVKRLDTGEVFSKRTMTKDEAQLPLDAHGKKDRGEVKDVKPGADGGKPDALRLPKANDVIEIETMHGWKTGKVLPISGSVLEVDIGEKKPVQAPIESQMWRWPKDAAEKADDSDETPVEPLTATLGEVAAANNEQKPGRKKRKKASENSEQVDTAPPEGCDW
jgi:hypothetical protein